MKESAFNMTGSAIQIDKRRFLILLEGRQGLLNQIGWGTDRGLVKYRHMVNRALEQRVQTTSFTEFIMFALIRAAFQILSFTRDVFRLSSVGRTQFRNNKMAGMSCC